MYIAICRFIVRLNVTIVLKSRSIDIQVSDWNRSQNGTNQNLLHTYFWTYEYHKLDNLFFDASRPCHLHLLHFFIKTESRQTPIHTNFWLLEHSSGTVYKLCSRNTRQLSTLWLLHLGSNITQWALVQNFNRRYRLGIERRLEMIFLSDEFSIRTCSTKPFSITMIDLSLNSLACINY